VPKISQRFILLLTALLTGCSRHNFPDAPPDFREFAYVANAGANTVSVLDLVYLRPDRTLKVGETPIALAINPVRNEVYAVNRGSGSISVIDAARTQIPTAAAPSLPMPAPTPSASSISTAAANSQPSPPATCR
jgi:YVTN family beta-propeller protein